MKLPTLEAWLKQGKKLWEMATPTNRKIFFPGVTSWQEMKSVLTKNWNNLKNDHSMFEQETVRTHNALKMHLEKTEKSKAYNDKAMEQVEKEDEKDIHGRIR